MGRVKGPHSVETACDRTEDEVIGGAVGQGAPKLKVAIIGSGLAGLSAAAELLDQGYEVDVYEGRAFVGGKVASWEKDGNHVEMGLHVVRPFLLPGGWVLSGGAPLTSLLRA